MAPSPISAAIRKAFGMKGGTDAFPMEVRFENEGVLAYHGHIADLVSSDAKEGVPFAELFCPELITRFPIDQINEAEAASASGAVIKPVLTFD